MVDQIFRELRTVFRGLARDRGPAVAATATLALGIGVTTTLFAVLHAVVLRPLPYDSPEELVAIVATHDERGITGGRAAMGDFYDWRQRARLFAGIAAAGHATLVLTEGGEPEEIPTAAVSSEFFRVLRVRPALGRDFLAEEETPGRDQVVVLSHRLWHRRFGGDPGVIGRQVELSGYRYTIVGVLPEDFAFFGGRIDFWAPMALDPERLVRRRRGMYLVGRLRPGVTRERADAEVRALARRTAEEYPDSHRGWGAGVVPLRERMVGEVRPALLLLFAAAASVLAIACANVGNLLASRAAGRRAEVAVRAALGAGRWRLTRLFLLEGTVLGAAGAGLGVALAHLGMRALERWGPGELPRIEGAGIGGAAVLFALLAALAAGLAAGGAVAVRGSRVALREALEADARGAVGSGRRRLAEGFLAFQVAVALLLLVGSGLLLRSFFRLSAVDPGFARGEVLVVNLFLPFNRYTDDRQRADFFARLVDRLEALPEVRSAATGSALPMNRPARGLETTFEVPGRTAPAASVENRAELRMVSPGYFRTLGIRRLAGRGFEPRDREGAPPVAVVNRTLAERHWPAGTSPVGRRLTVRFGEPESVEVVGVVADVRHGGLDATPRPTIYLSSLQRPSFFASVAVRTRVPPEALVPAVKEAVWSLDDEQAMTFGTMEGNVAAALGDRRFTLRLLLTFAAVALLLAGAGVYALAAAWARRRRAEIGLRMALGARPRDVLGLVIRRSLLLALLGIGIGAVTAHLLTRFLRGLLYGVSTSDPASYLAAAAVVLALTVAGSYLPARRASRIDPTRAIREG